MKKKYLPIRSWKQYLIIGSLVMVPVFLQSCGNNGAPRIKEGTTETILESSKGVITEVEEIEPGDEFLILDERVIDDKEKSLAIVHRLDGEIDTLTLQKIKKESASDPSRSALRSVLMYSLAASYFNRNLSNTSPNSAYYKNQAAFNKSTGLKSDLSKSAVSRRVTVPSGASKGYGGGKSFRSHGG